MYNRHSTRLKKYDYSKSGYYFITICTQDNAKLFGKIIDCEMELNDLGEIAQKEWYELKERYNIGLHEFVVMPNHIHGIIEILGGIEKGGIDEGVINNARTNPKIKNDRKKGNVFSMISPISNSLSIIIRSYKSCVTRKIRFRRGVIHNALIKPHNITKHNTQITIWHRDFYDHIIRNEIELNNIRQYIIDNPKKWKLDKNYSTK